MKSINIFNIYCSFRKAQGDFLGRGYRIPKDFDSFLENRLSNFNREKLEKMVLYLQTKWSHINVDEYFKYGFSLFKKGFSYSKFFDSRLLTYYIQKDKNIKREQDINKKKIIESIKFIKRYLSDNDINGGIERYCQLKNGFKNLAVVHYLNNDIDKFTLTIFIKYRYINLSDSDRALIPYISEKYRDICFEISQIEYFIVKLRRMF